MIITPAERRNAELFAEMLEGRGSVTDDADLGALLGFTSRLSTVDTDSDTDPEFRARLRQRLVAVGSVQGVASERGSRRVQGSRSRRRFDVRPSRRFALAAGVLVGLVGLSGVGAASGGANPGDPLYSVKRSREAAQLALARSDVSRGQLHLQFARNRLAEARQVTDDPAHFRQVLDDMDADTRTGVRELTASGVERRETAPLDIVDAFAGGQRTELAGLLDDTRQEQARTRLLGSIDLIDQVTQRSASLRGTLLCSGGVTGSTSSDELGPLARRCTSMGTRPQGGPVPGSPGVTGPTGTSRRGPAPSASPSAGRPAATSQPANGSTGASADGAQPNEPTAQPTPTQSGAQGILGTVTGTVGGVVGGLLDPPSGGSPAATPSPDPS